MPVSGMVSALMRPYDSVFFDDSKTVETQFILEMCHELNDGVTTE